VDNNLNEQAGNSNEGVFEITSKDSKIRALRVLTDEEQECADLAKEHFGNL
jgi:acetate kinase